MNTETTAANGRNRTPVNCPTTVHDDIIESLDVSPPGVAVQSERDTKPGNNFALELVANLKDDFVELVTIDRRTECLDKPGIRNNVKRQGRMHTEIQCDTGILFRNSGEEGLGRLGKGERGLFDCCRLQKV